MCPIRSVAHLPACTERFIVAHGHVHVAVAVNPHVNVNVNAQVNVLLF
jgi:hypothetical protein